MSEAALDRKFFVSFGVVMSVQHADVEKVRAAMEECGAKIVFQTISPDPLYLLRRSQVEQILNGDTSQLSGVHARKSRERSPSAPEKDSGGSRIASRDASRCILGHGLVRFLGIWIVGAVLTLLVTLCLLAMIRRRMS